MYVCRQATFTFLPDINHEAHDCQHTILSLINALVVFTNLLHVMSLSMCLGWSTKQGDWRLGSGTLMNLVSQTETKLL